MEADIVDGKLGEVAQYDVEFKGGKLVAKIDAKHPIGVEGGAYMAIDARAVKEAIKKAIPGKVDDIILDTVFGPLIG